MASAFGVASCGKDAASSPVSPVGDAGRSPAASAVASALGVAFCGNDARCRMSEMQDGHPWRGRSALPRGAVGPGAARRRHAVVPPGLRSVFGNRPHLACGRQVGFRSHRHQMKLRRAGLPNTQSELGSGSREKPGRRITVGCQPPDTRESSDTTLAMSCSPLLRHEKSSRTFDGDIISANGTTLLACNRLAAVAGEQRQRVRHGIVCRYRDGDSPRDEDGTSCTDMREMAGVATFGGLGRTPRWCAQHPEPSPSDADSPLAEEDLSALDEAADELETFNCDRFFRTRRFALGVAPC